MMTNLEFQISPVNSENSKRYYLHANIVIIDKKTGWFSSQNLSGGIGFHREFGVITQNSRLISKLFEFIKMHMKKENIVQIGRASCRERVCHRV